MLPRCAQPPSAVTLGSTASATPLQHVTVANAALYEVFFSILVRACPESVSVADDGNGNTPYVSAAERHADKNIHAIVLAPCSLAEKREQLERLHQGSTSTDICFCGHVTQHVSRWID
jgi:hypothetical protein